MSNRKRPPFLPGGTIRAEDLNEIADMTDRAHERARAATRLLWLSIAITVADIGLMVWSFVR